MPQYHNYLFLSTMESCQQKLRRESYLPEMRSELGKMTPTDSRNSALKHPPISLIRLMYSRVSRVRPLNSKGYVGRAPLEWVEYCLVRRFETSAK